MSARSPIPTSKLQFTKELLVGPLVTLALLTLIELADAAGFRVPDPSAIYFLAIVLSTLQGGLFGGFASAAITIIYAAFFYSSPHQFFSYDPTDLRRVLVLVVATPTIVVMIEAWKRKHQFSSGRRIGTLQRELSDRQRLEGPLLHLASIVESAEDAIYSKDLAGNILTWNKAAQKLFGYEAKEIIGRPISVLMPPDRQGEMVEILRRIMMGELVEHTETTRVRRDGTRIRVSISVSPVRNAAGNIVGASAIARPVR